MSLAANLRRGAEALGLPLADAQVDALLTYLDLILKWNRVYNLTSLRDPQQILTHHLLDSLASVPPLMRHVDGRGVRLLDVGSGAGLPGVVIAICRPELPVDCLDAVAKKAAFIQQVASELKMTHLRGLHQRVEQITDRYDVVCSRAFASLADFTRWSGGALKEGGVWLAMKGKRPEDEIAALPPEVEVFHVEQLQVPGLDAERCIVWMRRAAAIA
ncbi:MAG TPA: 16S rRNA (guanine(527)-N(7))-methyltransferase RsmG [Ramlibacter sp.]|uniref:16S rRNA (guanine(527)-N(7))-methyltransferase RsmG n=1 Tax=Ramlibacter sp. TaxID=1917967 RepID=UPI002CA19E52|nr:16S rRNA (guanine(527)-N(7))-methyltransferase RsmG [Ramlibacter sp.]HVZ42546.1 16S rRNA (guanine(527)-N(7))-methyltransferase RsmG [Ramlibacter sp.]